MKSFEIEYEKRAWRVTPDMRLVAEIEAELGGLSFLKHRFNDGGWTVTELVTLMQMLLQRGGKTVDFIELGDTMLKEGFAPYLSAAQDFLSQVPN